MLKKSLTLAASALVLFGAVTAQAHTTSIGFVPGANNGEVTFWTGSYHSGGVNEGTLTLAGANGTVFAPVTVAFNIGVTSTKPTGLVDGTNNFYWGGSFSNTSFPKTTQNALVEELRIWQGVTFSGLNPGDYSFTCGSTLTGLHKCGLTWGPGERYRNPDWRHFIGGGGTKPAWPFLNLEQCSSCSAQASRA